MARRVRFWDLAATVEGDFSAGVRMARDGRTYTVEHVVHGRWTPHERDAIIKQTAQADGRAVEIVIEQEPGSAGVSQIAAMVEMLAGFKVSGRRSTGDKLTRAGPLASQAEAGNVKLMEGAWDIAGFLDELASFPTTGVHDDRVDAASGAFLVLTEAEQDLTAWGGLLGGWAARGWTPR